MDGITAFGAMLSSIRRIKSSGSGRRTLLNSHSKVHGWSAGDRITMKLPLKSGSTRCARMMFSEIFSSRSTCHRWRKYPVIGLWTWREGKWKRFKTLRCYRMSSTQTAVGR
jgi:hypothetical protein